MWSGRAWLQWLKSRELTSARSYVDLSAGVAAAALLAAVPHGAPSDAVSTGVRTCFLKTFLRYLSRFSRSRFRLPGGRKPDSKGSSAGSGSRSILRSSAYLLEKAPAVLSQPGRATISRP